MIMFNIGICIEGLSCLKKLSIMLLLSLTLFISGCGNGGGSGQKELTVSAAASMRESLEEAGQKYMDENPDVKIIYNFGGSGSLQQQIIQGAPVDLFISASEDKYDQLLSKNLIDQNHSMQLLGNELVLIEQKNNKSVNSIEDLMQSNIKRIAIGTPQTVPAGHYAMQALNSAGVWSKVESKIINTKDVRQVLTYVETGNADIGFVYKTDALLSDKIKIKQIIGHSMHDPIIYPAGIVAASKNKDDAINFFNFLAGKEAMEIFKKYGFKAALD
jgi:molybdate transport system substrate-binding protein